VGLELVAPDTVDLQEMLLVVMLSPPNPVRRPPAIRVDKA